MLNQLCEHWSFLAGATFELIAQGSSHATYFVNTAENQFVLKFYAATTEIAQIQYEHSLLMFLRSTDFPFAIPVPIPTISGETSVAVEIEQQLLNAALLPRLVGQPMDRHNLNQIESAGLALAKLHVELAQFDPQGQFARLPFWGALEQIHPQVRDPFMVPQLLKLGLEEQQHFRRLLHEAIEAAPHFYATLPIQTIHADYISQNILVENNQVVGILDFEFATRDLRLFDYLSSLDQFSSFPWNNDRFADTIRAFSTGYRACNALTSIEMQSALVMWKLQRASSLIYWTGWLIEGKSNHQKIVNAVLETLRFAGWLESNQNQWLNALGFG